MRRLGLCNPPLTNAALAPRSLSILPSFVTRTFDPVVSTEKLYTADTNGNTLSGAGRTFVRMADNRIESVSDVDHVTSAPCAD